LYAKSVVRAANQNLAAADLLEVTLHAEIGVPDSEHLGVDRTVSGVTDSAAFAGSFVFKDVRASLIGVAAKAAFVFGQQRRPSTAVSRCLVWRMTIDAAHFAFRDRVMTGQAELAAHVGMTLKADRFLRALWVDNDPGAEAVGNGPPRGEAVGRFYFAARFRVSTARTVAGFAARVESIGAFGN